jgi:hypothetical protein
MDKEFVKTIFAIFSTLYGKTMRRMYDVTELEKPKNLRFGTSYLSKTLVVVDTGKSWINGSNQSSFSHQVIALSLFLILLCSRSKFELLYLRFYLCDGIFHQKRKLKN